MTIAEEVFDEVNSLTTLGAPEIDAIFYSRIDDIESIRRDNEAQGIILIFTDHSVFRLREDEGGVVMETGVYIPNGGSPYVH